MTDKDLKKEIEEAFDKLTEMVRGLPLDRQDALLAMINELAEQEVEDHEETPLGPSPASEGDQEGQDQEEEVGEEARPGNGEEDS